MNIIRKRRKRKDAAALPQYADLTPLEGIQSQRAYNTLQSLGHNTAAMSPAPSMDYHHPQDNQALPPYELPKQPPLAKTRS
ncbi:hypothetical protein RhiXN_03162 [Rhizoctonia solani]|uniref:Uncharacterized protein n=1 Tax=Rhizoctonia solani TaxID=456999 RepID=A0A8H8SVJ8_9AGAM|nr:uncharacterized protein RhiXN_03162 [Rhizoctonia solani]QRW18238.1 hypothetical protein RhiXN_03162 [Rhizoctonia solani]